MGKYLTLREWMSVLHIILVATKLVYTFYPFLQVNCTLRYILKLHLPKASKTISKIVDDHNIAVVHSHMYIYFFTNARTNNVNMCIPSQF